MYSIYTETRVFSFLYFSHFSSSPIPPPSYEENVFFNFSQHKTSSYIYRPRNFIKLLRGEYSLQIEKLKLRSDDVNL